MGGAYDSTVLDVEAGGLVEVFRARGEHAAVPVERGLALDARDAVHGARVGRVGRLDPRELLSLEPACCDPVCEPLDPHRREVLVLRLADDSRRQRGLVVGEEKVRHRTRTSPRVDETRDRLRCRVVARKHAAPGVLLEPQEVALASGAFVARASDGSARTKHERGVPKVSADAGKVVDEPCLRADLGATNAG